MKATVKRLATGTLIALFLTVLNVESANAEKNDFNSDSIVTILPADEMLTEGNIYNFIIGFYQEPETGLEFESWMTDTETWNFEFIMTNETEAGLELESWMTSEQIWDISEINNETALTIENWMTDSSVWK